MCAARFKVRRRIVARDAWGSKDLETSRGHTTTLAQGIIKVAGKTGRQICVRHDAKCAGAVLPVMRGKAKTSRRAEAKTTLRARGDRLKLSRRTYQDES